MALQQSVRSYLGIAKEVTKGTAVAPTDFIPVAKDSLKPLILLIRSMTQGYAVPTLLITTIFQAAHAQQLILAAQYSLTQLVTAYCRLAWFCCNNRSICPIHPHNFSKEQPTSGADDQPISYTLTDFYAVDVRSYPGCQFSDFSLKFNADGMLEYDTKTTGFSSRCFRQHHLHSQQFFQHQYGKEL
jgi:hypothetical protein